MNCLELVTHQKPDFFEKVGFLTTPVNPIGFMVKSKDKLLILDLDETLIHARETPLVRKSDFSVYTYHVYKRPYLDIFLTTCLDWFDVAVWTSSGSEYATEVVDKIFPDPQALEFMWTSDRCSIAYNYNYDLIDGDYPQYYSRKPLKKVKRRGYNLESVIAIDDTPQKMGEKLW